jgi:hypothetical protein
MTVKELLHELRTARAQLVVLDVALTEDYIMRDLCDVDPADETLPDNAQYEYERASDNLTHYMNECKRRGIDTGEPVRLEDVYGWLQHIHAWNDEMAREQVRYNEFTSEEYALSNCCEMLPLDHPHRCAQCSAQCA